MYTKRYSTAVSIPATASEVFALVDDHARLSSHMSRRSWAMVGGSMAIETDSGQGKAVGSRLRLHGVVFGRRLSVEETVVERTPPFRKVWETTGEPRLLVIGRYRMGFEIEALGPSSRLTVFIDYDWPSARMSRWLGVLFGGWYARWCTERMANDAARLISMPSERYAT
jgi:polyketide cyclase/dehydrase/lipid transport protein